MGHLYGRIQALSTAPETIDGFYSLLNELNRIQFKKKEVLTNLEELSFLAVLAFPNAAKKTKHNFNITTCFRIFGNIVESN